MSVTNMIFSKSKCCSTFKYMWHLHTRKIFWGAPKKVGALSYSLCSLYVNPVLGTRMFTAVLISARQLHYIQS
jgi:thiamine transporter ThiT